MNPYSSGRTEQTPGDSVIPPIIERQIAGLLDLTRTITEAEDLQAVLYRALQPIAETTGWCYGEVWLPDDQDETLRSAATWHKEDPALVQLAHASRSLCLTRGSGFLGRAWQSQTSEWISDLSAVSALALHPELLSAARLASGLFLPIIVHDRVHAVLAFFAHEVRPRNEPLLRLINLVAAQIGAALHRLEAQEAMRAREALLHSVTESAVDAIIAADPADLILTWNPAAERMFGYAAAEALGQPLKLLIPSRYYQVYPGMISSQRRGNPVGVAGQTIEINARHRDGHEFPAEVSLATWSSAAGDHLTFIIRDTSERKRHEAALRALNVELEARVAERTEQYLRINETLAASEQRYRQVVEDTTEVIFRTDAAGLWTLLNPAWTAITGFSVAESLGQPFINYVFPADRERNMALFRPLIAREKAFCRHEVRYTTRDGGYRWIEVFARLTTDVAGEITGTCGTLNDITERRQVELALRAAEDQLRRTNDELEQRVAERTAALAEANALLQRESLELAQTEQQLRASEERFRQITEHISEVFYIFDLASREILYVSPSYERIWGRSREGLYTHHTSFVDAVHPDDRERVSDALRRQSLGESTKEIYRVLLPDGSQRWISDRTFLVYSSQGEPYRVVGLAQDVTEQRQVSDTLERRVAERTAALSEANAELERAARLKDEFLANMSHELRTPLNTILTLTEAVTEGVYGMLNDRQQHALDAVTESGQHLLALINDILDLTKIESGKVDLAIEPLEVEEICTASLRMVRQLAHAKQLQISSSLDPLVDMVEADPRRLKQILVNLLSNAVKFTSEGGKVSLRVQGDRDAEVIHFSVEDTGIGIDSADIPRLFKPFVQLDSRLNRRHEGTGLGLALVAHLTELHSGGISVQSTPGAGSCFTVTLPWRIPAEHKAIAAEAPHKKISPLTYEQPVVLLAEDNELVLHTTLDYLAAYGYNVCIARNGAEALVMTREQRPEVILMDIHMPVMDGFEAIRQIRADPTISTTPIIALTALAMVGDRERCISAGADDYLSKPVRFSLLIERIEILRRRT